LAQRSRDVALIEVHEVALSISIYGAAGGSFAAAMPARSQASANSAYSESEKEPSLDG
jgi:hypothetical protein